MKRNISARRVRSAPHGQEDIHLKNRILDLADRDIDMAAIAALSGVQRGLLNLEGESVISLLDRAIDNLKRYVCIRDITTTPSSNHGATLSDILSEDITVQLNPFQRGWRLVRYTQRGSGDDKNSGDSE